MEGYAKNNTPQAKKKFFNERKVPMTFNGNDAPLKAVRAMMQKYGIRVEDL
jgi:hypothetical protein